MSAVWKTLRACGVPVGLQQGTDALDWDALRDAIVAAAAEQQPQQLLGPLCAWLDVFSKQWPNAYKTQLGARRVHEAIEQLQRQTEHDPNRHLKFRRIAARNLSRLV